MDWNAERRVLRASLKVSKIAERAPVKISRMEDRRFFRPERREDILKVTFDGDSRRMGLREVVGSFRSEMEVNADGSKR